MIIFSIISAISTAVIAYFSYQTYNMYQRLKDKDEEYKQQTNDLYQAIVISTLLSGPSSTGSYSRVKDKFKQEYKGKIKIFSDD